MLELHACVDILNAKGIIANFITFSKKMAF